MQSQTVLWLGAYATLKYEESASIDEHPGKIEEKMVETKKC